MFQRSTLENPETIDGFRFERMRNDADSDSKFQVRVWYALIQLILTDVGVSCRLLVQGMITLLLA